MKEEKAKVALKRVRSASLSCSMICRRGILHGRSAAHLELPEIISCPRKETNAISTGASLTIEFSHYQEALCFKRSYTARLSCRADSFIRLPCGTINIVKTVQRCMFRGKEVKLRVLLAICIH